MMGRLLGLDFGMARIGVAVSDAMQIVATPRGYVDNKVPKQGFKDLVALIDELEIKKVIIGMPLHLDGGKGELAMKVDEFVEQLSRRTHVPLETWDERLSTAEATRVLQQAGVKAHKHKQVVDQLAAQLILQNYLDAHASDMGF